MPTPITMQPRTDSVAISPISTASISSSSACSRFSFGSSLTTSSVSSTHSRTFPDNSEARAIRSPGTLKRASSLNAKLVFGICGSNCKPGLLYTQPDDALNANTARLVFLPLARSFKNDYIDLPSAILTQFLSVFVEARKKIPCSSKFYANFSDDNFKRLQELLEQAKFWEESARIDSKFLIGTKMHVIRMDDEKGGAEIVQRLLQQPNVFEILAEASKLLTSEELGIPSPPTAPTPPVRRSMRSSSGLRLRASPLCEDHHERIKALTTNLRQLSCSDSIVSLPLDELDQLIDNISTLHIPLYSWFGPYEDDEDLVATVADTLLECFCRAGAAEKIESSAEKEEISISGADAALQWAKDAQSFKDQEAKLNVWCLALQRCRKVKVSSPV